jgi:hypothetical protein
MLAFRLSESATALLSTASVCVCSIINTASAAAAEYEFARLSPSPQATKCFLLGYSGCNTWYSCHAVIMLQTPWFFSPRVGSGPLGNEYWRL